MVNRIRFRLSEVDNCVDCVYAVNEIYKDEDNPEVPLKLLSCRRYPPVIFVLNGEVFQEFPNANRRCGEFSRRPQPQMLPKEEGLEE